MVMQPEGRIVAAALRKLQELDVFAMKVHGGQFGRAGMPDLYVIADRPCPGCGAAVARPHHIEVKQPGNSPTRIQRYMLRELERSGAIVGVAHSAAEVLDIIGRGDV